MKTNSIDLIRAQSYNNYGAFYGVVYLNSGIQGRFVHQYSQSKSYRQFKNKQRRAKLELISNNYLLDLFCIPF